MTTVSTGRSYLRARQVLGEAFEEIVAPDVLMIVEHGTKIVDRNGTVIYADYFKPNELDHIVDFSRANESIISLMWFVSPDPEAKMQIWCKNENDVPAVAKERGAYAEVFHCAYDGLRRRLSAYALSNISAKLEKFVLVENLKLHFTRSEIDIIFQDNMLEYVRNIASKSKAIQYVAAHHGAKTGDMLLAGNAINDIDMLNLPADTCILVGSDQDADGVIGYLTKPEMIVRVQTPEDLGLYLQKL